MNIKKYIEFNSFDCMVKEGLIKTYPIKTSIKIISREISNQNIKYKVDSEDSTGTIFIAMDSKDFLGKDYLKYREIDKYFIKELENKTSKSTSVQMTIE